mgnify:CR=1 FL=1
MNPIIWLIILVFLVFVEIITLGLATIWFAGGALAAFFLSLFFDNLLVEIIVFIVVSLLLLYFTRPWVMKYFNPKRVKTNLEGVVGKEALVVTPIDNINGTGQVVVGGMEWTARAASKDRIEKGSKVIIKEVTGVKVIVEEIDES